MLASGRHGTLTAANGTVYAVDSWVVDTAPTGTIGDIIVRLTFDSPVGPKKGQQVNLALTIPHGDLCHTVLRATITNSKASEVPGRWEVECRGGMLGMYQPRPTTEARPRVTFGSVANTPPAVAN